MGAEHLAEMPPLPCIRAGAMQRYQAAALVLSCTVDVVGKHRLQCIMRKEQGPWKVPADAQRVRCPAAEFCEEEIKRNGGTQVAGPTDGWQLRRNRR